MRKIFAYVVTVVTLIATMIFFVPSIKDSTNFAMEYTGGFEALYKTNSSMKDVKDNTVAKTISDGMNKILEINGVRDAIVTVEDGDYVRVNVTTNNQMESDRIRDLIQNSDSYEISFRDAEDNLLATGDQILKEVGASYTGQTNYYGYPIINLNIKDTELLEEITTKVTQSQSDKNLVIWVGFDEENDSYANIKTDVDTKAKVIYNATVSEPLDDEIITVTGQYTEEEAKNTVNLINSGTYDYDLEIVQIKSIKAKDAISDKTTTLIAIAVITLIPMLAMGIYFKLEGVFSLISVLVSEFLTVFFFNKIVGVINAQVIAAFILTNVVLFTLMFILLSKYKNVMITNKSPIKAYRETFKKNSPIILDSCITMLLFAIVTYFVGNNAHNFAILLATSSVAIFISVYLLQRFVMFLTCDCFNKNDKAVIVSGANLNKNEEEETTNKDLDSYTKPAFLGFVSLTSLGIIVVLLTTLIFKAPFGFYGDAKNTATIEISTLEQQFATEAEVEEFFNQDDLKIDVDSIEFSKEDDRYVVTVKTNNGIAKHEDSIKDKLIEICGENDESQEYYIVYVNDYDNAALLITLKSTLFTSGLSLILISLYFALRYKYSYALATISVSLMTVISLIALFAITRIPVNSYTIIGISIACAYSLFILVPLFTRIKEYMNDTKKVYLSYEERVACFKKGRLTVGVSMVVSTLILDVLSLIVMFFDLSNFSMYLAFIFGSIFTLIYSLLFISKIWLLFENKSDRRKKTFKNKNISKSKYRTLDEQVFIGLND